MISLDHKGTKIINFAKLPINIVHSIYNKDITQCQIIENNHHDVYREV